MKWNLSFQVEKPPSEEFIGINQSGLAKNLRKYQFYLGRDFFVYKSYADLDNIYNSEAYKIAISKAESSSPYLKDGWVGMYRYT